MGAKFKKIDAIIVVVLLVIAGLVLYKSGYIFPEETKKTVTQKIEEVPPSTPELPESITAGYMRSVSPDDEGVHFDKIRISREWWYFSAVFDDENSDMKDWIVVISFNHMARSDFRFTLKPDLLVVTLIGPNGEVYGGMINKIRGLGIIQQPTLKAKSPGVDVTFEDSWAKGEAPRWQVHAEDKDIDKNYEIVIDLEFFAPGGPLWTIGERPFDKSKSNIANYMFTGCNVTGTVEIDGIEYKVKGTGHHEHSWSPNIITRKTFNGWDWCHMTLDNGWNIYFTNYHATPQFITTKITNLNQFDSLVITTNEGQTFTKLENIDPEITRSYKIFPFAKLPSEISITAKPGITQILLKPYKIQLDIEINVDNSYDKAWKFPTYVGMEIGRSTITGKITWSDDDCNHEIELNGIGVLWSMRALI